MDKDIASVSKIIDAVKALTLKGKADFGEDWFWWELGEVELCFDLDIQETKIEYYRRGKNKAIALGHMHCDNSDLLKLIQDINNNNKIVKILITPLFSSFSVVDKTIKKKRSWFLVRRYYSI